MIESRVFVYDQNYSYLKQSLEHAGSYRHRLRDGLRDYARVLLPLNLHPGSTLLDVGSNIGRLGHNLAHLGINTIGVDLNLSAIQSGKTLYGGERNNVSLVADGISLPFGNETFDAVASQDMFEHLPDEENVGQMLGEMGRVLKGDKMFHKITVVEDELNFPNDESHFIKWTTEDWAYFFEQNGWRILENSTRHFPILSNVSLGNFLIQRS